MHLRRWTYILATALAGGAVGCDTPGERAATGDCPPTEDCSEVTPDGLYFRGAPLGGVGQSVKRTAVGGTQTVTVLIGRSSETRTEFLQPFEATVDPPLAVEPRQQAVLELTAEAVGQGYLRIANPDSGELFDRVLVRAAEIDRVSLAPLDYPSDALLYAGGQTVLVARLQSEADDRLVDEGIEFSQGGAATIARSDWDLITVSDVSPGPLEFAVTTSAGESYDFELEAVDAIDELVLEPIDGFEFEEEIAVNEVALLCFAGRLGGVPVAGLDWHVEVDGPVEVSPFLSDSCFSAEGEAPGEATIVVSAAGESVEVDLRIVEESEYRILSRMPAVEESPATPGARASR